MKEWQQTCFELFLDLLRHSRYTCLGFYSRSNLSWWVTFLQIHQIFFLKAKGFRISEQIMRSNSILRTCILLHFIAVTFEIKISMKYPERSQHKRYLLICLFYLTSYHEVHAFVSMFLPFDSNILELIAPTINNYIIQSYYLKTKLPTKQCYLSPKKNSTFISIRSNLSVVLI